ncbi:MAG: hypothetical protein ACPG5N_04955 [Planktomarina sp.]
MTGHSLRAIQVLWHPCPAGSQLARPKAIVLTVAAGAGEGWSLQAASGCAAMMLLIPPTGIC